MNSSPKRLLTTAALATAVAITGCQDSGVEPEVTSAPPRASSVIFVAAGESIQEAVDAASPGDMIRIAPGTYQQTVTIDKPNITLWGRGAVLENPGGANNGISVTDNGDGVRIAHVTVRGYGRNGIFMTRVQGFVVSDVIAEDNGDYGIFPTRSSDGAIVRCTASGHADAGLYIGQSERVVMAHNVAFGNVIGIEISNSTGIVVRANDAHDNTIGILAVLLPLTSFRTVAVATDIRILHNTITNNNLPNFADPGSLPSFVPSGSGILVVGTDRTIVEGNRVSGNDWVGIGVGSTATFVTLAGLPPEVLEGIEPHPDNVAVRDNRVFGNGASPPPGFPLPSVDLLWDGTGTANCWQGNRYVTSAPEDLPSCR